MCPSLSICHPSPFHPLPISHLSLSTSREEDMLESCTHIVMEGLGFARVITSVPPLWGSTVQVPKYTATTREHGGVSVERNSGLAGQLPASSLKSQLQAGTSLVSLVSMVSYSCMAGSSPYLISLLHLSTSSPNTATFTTKYYTFYIL